MIEAVAPGIKELGVAEYMLGTPVRKKVAEAVPGASRSKAVTVMEDGTVVDEDGAVYRPLWLIEPADDVAGETDHVTFGY